MSGRCSESEFVLVASKSRTCTAPTTLASLTHEQWVMPQTDMGYYKNLTTLQDNTSVLKTSRQTDSVVTIYNLVLNADYLTVIPRDDCAVRFRPVYCAASGEDELPVARYAAVWSKITELKKSASVLAELAKQYASLTSERRR